MLYEGAMQSVQEAIAAHRLGDILARGNAVTKAVEIIGELRLSLRREVVRNTAIRLAGCMAIFSAVLFRRMRRSPRACCGSGSTHPNAAGRLDGCDEQCDEYCKIRSRSKRREARTMAKASVVRAGTRSGPFTKAPAEPQNRSWQF